MEEGIVKRCNLGTNKADAIKQGAKLNALIKDYEKQLKARPNAMNDQTLTGLVRDYYLSYEFNELKDETKSQYNYF